ncbi:NRDE family protein [Colwellia sp. M166]|uniref:NRDE family protein n=1 Tax=Colwellia sp. M166 TaxID=2583805 RepID=UPI00211DA939|nr:NRDE family protein [Colwellia sp. M166]UUO22901.1 NRDE family protein [Colwellia sp. M166]|tara:strand:- start:12158 stop:12922 length:765 start_codon:yes stop_codon:yes gene_type:complete
MCILFIAVKQHPDYPVIICANRDEFHQRPTQNMHWWAEEKILAGKDLQAGGTWLGLTPEGHFSALTNFRQPEKFDKNKPSRGDLVVQALKNSPLKTEQYLSAESYQYNDFNLIFGQLNNLQAFDSVNQKLVRLAAGFHSVSNGALDDTWPKMALGLNALEALVTTNNLEIETLFKVMSNQETAKQESLPITGLSKELELLLSSIFIVSPDYGTRSSAIILQANTGEVKVYESNYDSNGDIVAQNNFQFQPTANN